MFKIKDNKRMLTDDIQSLYNNENYQKMFNEKKILI